MDVVCLGESLIDLPSTVSGATLADAPSFAKVPAGAPGNVAVAAARLGLCSAFVTKVGEDPFGDSILQTFASRGVDVTRSKSDPEARTGLAFVSIREDGERDFLFYFDPARDLALRTDELDVAFLQSARAFHYGSISLIAEPCRTTTMAAAKLARAAGALISYDPNLRPRLWPDQGTMCAFALAGFSEADIAKVAADELETLARTVDAGQHVSSETSSAQALFTRNPNLKLLCVTDGRAGSRGYVRGLGGTLSVTASPGFAVHAIDATGAGDAFVAGLLAFLLQQADNTSAILASLRKIASEALAYANACGALAATERGASMSGLNPEAVEVLLKSAPL